MGKSTIIAGWWIYIYIYIGNVIIPTEFHIFQRSRSTTNQKHVDKLLHICEDCALERQVKLRMDNSKSQHPFIDCFPMKIADFVGQNI